MNSETFKEDRSTPFYDPSLSVEDRIDWLLRNLTLEEKCGCIGSTMPDIPRLGILGVGVGGEAAHGVQQRNDWRPGLGDPEPTTSFPQPIGMSASWDKERIEKAGEVTGIEARVIARRHNWDGLSRWAPTVDLERDPRWGRNEEGYGEDPHLTGEMAGHYILGMQGNDPAHIRCASTLKHFYANNVEEGRGYKNSTVDPRNREELYLETFRHVAKVGHPEGVMTAYNKINGVVGMFNPEVQRVLKDECGIVHAVSDGGAPDLARSMQHRYGTDAEVVAAALHAGIDGLVNDLETFQPAAMEALELGLITEADLDKAIANQMRTKLRLGVYDREVVNPYDHVTEADLGCAEHTAVSLDMAHASLVLLKNEGILPLAVDKIKGKLALIGPLGGRWDQDWYGGEPMYKSTLKNGLEKILGQEVLFDDGLDRVTLTIGGRPVVLREEKKPEKDETVIRVAAGQPGDTPETFIYEEYGDNCVSLKSTTYGQYIVPLLPGYGKEGQGMPESEAGALVLGPKVHFDWFSTGGLHVEAFADGNIILRSRWEHPVVMEENGKLRTEQYGDAALIKMDIADSGSERAAALAREAETVILALGSHPMIPAKEELDRRSMNLPANQETLLHVVNASNENTVLMLFANFPFVSGEFGKTKGILLSPTGSQDMGQAASDALLGLYAPAGRLAQRWPAADDVLPCIDDYDIIGGDRIDRYSCGSRSTEFAFGFGLSYTSFAYGKLEAVLAENAANPANPASAECGQLRFTVDVTNTGSVTSDEVVQIYAHFPETAGVKRPVHQLIAFTRIHDVKPGETRKVELTGDIAELKFYDVRARKMILASGSYEFRAMRPEQMGNALNACCGSANVCSGENAACLELVGEELAKREAFAMTGADHYDSQKGVEIVEGFYGKPAVCGNSRDGLVPAGERRAELVFNDFRLPEDAGLPRALRVLLCADEESSVKVTLKVGASPCVCAKGAWEGNTKAGMPGSNSSPDERLQKELTTYYNSLPGRYAYVVIPLEKVEEVAAGAELNLKLVLRGDVKVVQVGFVK